MNEIDITKTKYLDTLKKGIWIYIFLLIFEGALRKWFLPSLATPLLVVRDPLAMWLILMSWKRGVLKMNAYTAVVGFVGIISFFIAILFGHGELLIAIYGARTLLIYFPLMFVIGQIFNKEDVIRVGKLILCISIGMVIINIFQYISPQSAWINRGVGGDITGSGFGGALGYFRSSGTFSFATGNASFWGLTGAFLFYFWLVPKKISRWLLIMSSIAFLIAIPISISRTVFFQALLSLSFVGCVLLRKPQYLWRFLVTVFVIVIITAVLAQTSLFNTSIEVFLARFTSANESEGGAEGVLIDRFLGGMVNAITGSENLPFWGYGIGIGSNMAAVYLSGDRAFILGEAEWGRMIGEMGVILGLSVILIRIILVIQLTFRAIRMLIQEEPLAWMLLSFGGLTILQGLWAQPTALGFSTLIGGLLIAATSEHTTKKNQIIETKEL
ncbi:hypothetical protein [Dysgonomonas sp. BGC7]|uniref:hypothetical protein n=1 Tax=Dysgonomonas sp. BGC7 TaxID=1658008 RepID=UPI000A59EFCE|nr:hypothetical protein [Dysgonomonas sp. BGC7]MBD8389761.1 hypothetical protein [Dysgonomonas sp. BGC7]